jgi:hypothetical protein
MIDSLRYFGSGIGMNLQRRFRSLSKNVIVIQSELRPICRRLEQFSFSSAVPLCACVLSKMTPKSQVKYPNLGTEKPMLE